MQIKLERQTSTTTLFPYTTLFRSRPALLRPSRTAPSDTPQSRMVCPGTRIRHGPRCTQPAAVSAQGSDAAESRVRQTSRVRARSEEHTSELQSPVHLVWRLLLEQQ